MNVSRMIAERLTGRGRVRRLSIVFGCALLTTTSTVVPASARTGKATHYTLESGGGNCSYPSPPANGLYVALSPAEYAKGARCGGHLDVTGPRGTVRVKIIDQCPPCSPGHLDLSRAAFARIADPRKGVVRVTYRLVRDPRPSGKLAFRVKEGSSQWWLGLLVINHGNPLTSVEIRQSGRWRKLLHTDYNYWLAEKPGPGPGPFTVRITDARGHRKTVRKIRLAPETIQRTNVKMY